MKLKFSERSRQHLRDIHDYTLESFGARQVAIYRGAIQQGLSTLRQFPMIGLSHRELPGDVRAFRIKEHWVCYSVYGDTILIHAFIQTLTDFETAPGDRG